MAPRSCWILVRGRLPSGTVSAHRRSITDHARSSAFFAIVRGLCRHPSSSAKWAKNLDGHVAFITIATYDRNLNGPVRQSTLGWGYIPIRVGTAVAQKRPNNNRKAAPPRHIGEIGKETHGHPTGRVMSRGTARRSGRPVPALVVAGFHRM